MVSPALGSLVQRGLVFSGEFYQDARKDPENPYQMPLWGAIMLGLTLLFFIMLSSAVEYTFGRVIPTLVMVESPEEIVFEPLASDDPDAATNKTVEPELLLAKPQPITASFRGTIRHLQAKGGFRARFRGLSMYLVFSFVTQALTGLLRTFLGTLVAPIVAVVLCAQLSLAWTHIVISDPNPKPWFKRIPSYKTWKIVAGPTAILSIAEQAAIVLPAYLAVTSDFIDSPHSNDSSKAIWIAGIKGLSILIISVLLTFMVVIPASATLVRVQASLLPDECESVVPFDRSFGGKVIPQIIGGSGMIGVVDAWKSFDWSARIRLFKAYAKVLAMQIAIGFLAIAVFSAQLALIVGKDYKKLFPAPLPGEPTTGNGSELL